MFGLPLDKLEFLYPGEAYLTCDEAECQLLASLVEPDKEIRSKLTPFVKSNNSKCMLSV